MAKPVKLKNGRFEIHISYRTDKGPRSKRKVFDTRRECVQFEKDFLNSLKTDNAQEHTNIKFIEILNLFLEHNEITANEESIADKKLLADRFLNKLYNKKYTSIKGADYIKIVADIRASEYSLSRKNKVITMIKAINRFAYNFYDLRDRAKALQKLPMTSDDVKEIIVWNPQQFDLFISQVSQPIYRMFFITAYRTGLRRGELRALRKEHYDGVSLTIEDSMRRDANSRKSLKTKSSKREVKLDRICIDILDELKLLEGPYLFGGEDVLSNSSIARAHEQAIDSANDLQEILGEEPLPYITLHDFRHCHASNLIAAGANIVAVSKRLGHSNIQTTLNTYTHLLDKSADELLEILEKL